MARPKKESEETKECSIQDKILLKQKELSKARDAVKTLEIEYKELLKLKPKEVEKKQDLGELVRINKAVFKNSVDTQKAVAEANKVRMIKKRVDNAKAIQNIK